MKELELEDKQYEVDKELAGLCHVSRKKVVVVIISYFNAKVNFLLVYNKFINSWNRLQQHSLNSMS